jgi:L-aspartate oxidase
LPSPTANDNQPTALAVAALRKTMTQDVGLERNEAGLTAALAAIAKLETANAGDPDLRNMTAASMLIAGAALARRESRGGHFRSDYPTADAARATRTFTTLAEVRASAAHAVREVRAATQLKAVR